MKEPLKGSTGLTFARPLKPAGASNPAPARTASMLRSSHAYTLGGLVALSCAVFLLQTRQDAAQNLPASAQKKRSAAPAKRVQVALAERGAITQKDVQLSRPSLDFYTKGVRGSLFSAPQPAPVKEPPAPKIAKVKVPPITPVAVNPFADWTYAGSLTSGDTKLALLENRITKEGQYVRQGQSFMGLAQVKSVTDQMVTLVSAGKPLLLAKSDAMNTTPLTASAAYLTQQPQQQMAQQQMMQANMAMAMSGWQGQMGGVGMTLPNGMQLSPDRAARFRNRMNNRFDGGGGQGGDQSGVQGGGRGNRSGARGGGNGGGGGGRQQRRGSQIMIMP